MAPLNRPAERNELNAHLPAFGQQRDLFEQRRKPHHEEHRHRRNRGVAGFLGGMARVFGGDPNRLPLLPAELEFTSIALIELPGFLSQHPELFRRRP